MADQNQTIKKLNQGWIRLLISPALVLGSGMLVIAVIGIAQRTGWIQAASEGTGGATPSSSTDTNTLYACPMLCTDPLQEPGNCPVCNMPLVPTTQTNASTVSQWTKIEPAARRVANIQTAKVQAVVATRHIRAIGRLSYDEGRIKTLAAYVDGRIDRLYADYTGAVVHQGDELANLYSPELYTAQTELLATLRTESIRQGSPLGSSLTSRNLVDSSRQKLNELGMTEQQIANLIKTGKPSTRVELVAPLTGTVIEKMAAEGQYVKTGEPIYRLADLSMVWLMLELFPEQASQIHYGQSVTAELQSLPNETIRGRVAFIDPRLDEQTRTIGVRVVIPNPNGRLRIGDYATASIDVPVTDPNKQDIEVFDPELAKKWISPRHPHVIKDEPGKCPMCGIDLVPSIEFGYLDEPPAERKQLVVPRDAVLMAGDNSVIYVEVEPGRFELRRVELGPTLRDTIVVLSGVSEDEIVATHGNFLIDSQMQLSGNPSLIDPDKAARQAADVQFTADMLSEIEKLPPDDRELAMKQQICPISEAPLGSMGVPIKVDVEGAPIFICCEGCRKELLRTPEKYIAKLPKESRP
jgi:Cu(I)/Ag(I) efflux system membrane fusion protein